MAYLCSYQMVLPHMLCSEGGQRCVYRKNRTRHVIKEKHLFFFPHKFQSCLAIVFSNKNSPFLMFLSGSLFISHSLSENLCYTFPSRVNTSTWKLQCEKNSTSKKSLFKLHTVQWLVCHLQHNKGSILNQTFIGRSKIAQ